MPGIKTHIIQAALSSAALYPFAGTENTAVFGLSVVLIDVDHVVEYVRQTGSPKIWGVFPCCKIVEKNHHRGFYVLNVFHTAEFLLLTGLLGLLHPAFFYVMAGCLWHCALDIFMLIRGNATFVRALSVIEYIIRCRNPRYIVRFHDLLNTDAVTMPTDSWDYSAWIRHWQNCGPFC